MNKTMQREEVSNSYNVQRISFWPWLQTNHILVLRRDKNDQDNAIYGELDGESIIEMNGESGSYKNAKGATEIKTLTRKIRINAPKSILLYGIGLYSLQDVHDFICEKITTRTTSGASGVGRAAKVARPDAVS